MPDISKINVNSTTYNLKDNRIPDLSNDSTTFLCGDGTWVAPTVSTMSVSSSVSDEDSYLYIGELTEKTVSGNPVTFTTDTSKALTGLTIPITPIQSGSGDPSPSNVRPISGYSSVTVTRNGTTYSVSFGSDVTVYYGTLDAVTGVLTATMGMVDLGDLSWAARGTASSTHQFRASVPNGKTPSSTQSGTGIGYCSSYNVVSKTYSNMVNNDVIVNSWAMGSDYFGIVVMDTRYQDSQEFKNAVSGVKLVYELNEPITYQLSPAQVKTIVGQNTISTNTTGTNVIKYLTIGG